MLTNTNAAQVRKNNAIAIGLAGILAIAGVIPAWAQSNVMGKGGARHHYGVALAHPNGYASGLYASAAPSDYRGSGCFVVTDRTRGIRHWQPLC